MPCMVPSLGLPGEHQRRRQALGSRAQKQDTAAGTSARAAEALTRWADHTACAMSPRRSRQSAAHAAPRHCPDGSRPRQRAAKPGGLPRYTASASATRPCSRSSAPTHGVPAASSPQGSSYGDRPPARWRHADGRRPRPYSPRRYAISPPSIRRRRWPVTARTSRCAGSAPPDTRRRLAAEQGLFGLGLRHVAQRSMCHTLGASSSSPPCCSTAHGPPAASRMTSCHLPKRISTCWRIETKAFPKSQPWGGDGMRRNSPRIVSTQCVGGRDGGRHTAPGRRPVRGEVIIVEAVAGIEFIGPARS